MKTNLEFINEMENEIKLHTKEIERLKSAIKSLEGDLEEDFTSSALTSNATTINESMKSFTQNRKEVTNPNENVLANYPYGKDYTEKALFFLQTEGRCLSASEINDAIFQIEGKINGEKAIKNFSNSLSYGTRTGKLLSFKMNSSRLYCYYALPEFIEETANGYMVKLSRQPSQDGIKTLSDYARSPENYKWTISEKIKDKIKKA